MTVVEILPHDQAVLDALDVLDNPIGFADAPAGALDAVRSHTGPDYVVVHPISGLRSASDVADSTGDVELVYQTTIVARLPHGARDLIDKIETALLAVAIPGRAVVRITPDEVGPVRPDNDTDPHTYYATPRWRLWTTPA